MSVHELRDGDGEIRGFRVRYRLTAGANPKTATFLLHGQGPAKVRKAAERFEAEQLGRRDRGEMTTDRGKQTLRDFGLEYKERYAAVEHTERTQKTNAVLWNKHVLPKLGDYRLTDLSANPEIVQGWKSALVKEGVGEGSIGKALAILSAVLTKAVEWNRIPSNPARTVKAPNKKRKRAITAIAMTDVERIRRHLNQRDATLISVLAYCGLRPGEALALTWADIRERTIMVDKAISLGEEKGTKTGAIRSAELPATVKDDLSAWQKSTGVMVGLVFPGHDGGHWTDSAWRNWRSRVFQPACEAIGLATITVAQKEGRTKHKRKRYSQTYDGPRPYDLRHSCACYLLRAYDDLVYVAARMGHSIKMLSDVYSHEIAEQSGQPRMPLDDQIKQARSTRKGGLRAA